MAECRFQDIATRYALTACCVVRVQVDEPVTTVPTIGFNVETLQYKNIKFQVRVCVLAWNVFSILALFVPAVCVRSCVHVRQHEPTWYRGPSILK